MIKDKIDKTDEILFNMRQAFLKLLPLTTIIVFSGLCALAPLYITMGIMTRQMTEKTKTP